MERNDIEASINAAYAEKNSETSKMEMFALNKIMCIRDRWRSDVCRGGV